MANSQKWSINSASLAFWVVFPRPTILRNAQVGHQSGSKEAAQSWQMNNRSETIADGEYDFGFAIDWMRKDLGFALDVAQELGLHLEIANLVDAHYDCG